MSSGTRTAVVRHPTALRANELKKVSCRRKRTTNWIGEPFGPLNTGRLLRSLDGTRTAARGRLRRAAVRKERRSTASRNGSNRQRSPGNIKAPQQERSARPGPPEIAVALDAFSRPVLRLAIKPVAEAPAIQVFISHLKSKSPTRIFGERWFKENQELYKPHDDAIGAGLSTVRRTAEATALRIILNEHMVGKPTPTVVLGDLNDGHLSNTLAILTGQPKYLTPLARGGRDTALYSGQALQEYRSQRDVYYTYIYQGVHESLDHILVSEEFYDMSRMRLWAFEGMDVYNDHLNQPEHKEAEGAIDHGVVRAHFVYKPTPEARAKMRG